MDDDPADDDPLAHRLRAAKPARQTLADRVCTAKILDRHVSIPELDAAGYVIDELISAGSFGTVFLGRQRKLGRRVALKQLRPERVRLLGAAALLKEELTLGKLNHPNVVQIIDVIATQSEGTLIAMEYVDGGSLAQWQSKPRPWREILAMYLQAADGLAAVHAAGMLHLDFKPANVLVGSDGRVRVADFGLSRPHTDPTEGSDRDSDSATDPTDPELPPRGTRAYNSPEQRSRRPVDGRSDQFSFCAALYESLAGRLPFGDLELARMADAGAAAAMPAAPRGWPRHVAAALRRGLAPRPADRWPDMNALAEALRRTPWHRRPQIWGLVGAALVALPAAMALATDSSTCGDARDQLVGAWDDERRASLGAVYRDSDAPWAAAVGSTVIAALDRRADVWVTEMTAACEDARRSPAGPVVIARLGCLDRVRQRMASATDILVAADRDVLERGDDVVRELDAAGCGTEPVASVPGAAIVPEVIAEVDRASLLLAAGRAREARDAAERAVELAQRHPASASTAEAHLARGLVLDVLGHDADALAELDVGVAAAVEAHRDDLAARGWQAMTHIAARDLGDLARAESTLRIAEATLARVGNPPRARADLLDVRGAYLSARGDDTAAEGSHRAALTELAGQIEDDDPRWAQTWTMLAGVRARRGDLDEALLLDQRALDIRVQRLGPSHPDVGESLLGLALVRREAGEVEAALQDVARAQEIMVSNFGPSSLRAAPAMTLRAEMLVEQPDVDQAEALAREAWAIQKAQLPRTHSDRTYGAIVVLIDLAGRRRDWDEVLELSKARRTDVLHAGDHESVGICDNGIAYALLRLGRPREAEAVYAELATDPRQSPLLRAYGLAGRGKAALDDGRPGGALEHLETALSEFMRMEDVDPLQLAETRASLAHALIRAGGDTTRARELALGALAYYREHAEAHEPEIRGIESALRDTSKQRGGP